MSEDWDPDSYDIDAQTRKPPQRVVIPIEEAERIRQVNRETREMQQAIELKARWPAMGVPEIFGELEPINYLTEALDICPGAPTMIAGYGFGGKTMLTQSMALSVASGGNVWDEYPLVKQGKVLHVDYEQGARLTRARYQRLSAGMSLKPADLGDNLTLVSMPQFYADAQDAEAFLLKASAGYTMAIIDSFRACSPTVDENDSEARLVLDKLTRVSEKTGCCFVVIHHAKKKQNDRQADPIMDIRGSGALFDACASVFALTGGQGEQKVLHHLKSRNRGTTNAAANISIFDVAVDDDPRAGVAVKAKPKPVDGSLDGESKPSAYDGIRKAIIDVFAKQPEPKSGNAIVLLSKKSRNSVLATVNVMLTAGELVRVGKYDYRLDVSALVKELGPGELF